jgi:hypothetical protein
MSVSGNSSETWSRPIEIYSRQYMHFKLLLVPASSTPPRWCLHLVESSLLLGEGACVHQ